MALKRPYLRHPSPSRTPLWTTTADSPASEQVPWDARQWRVSTAAAKHQSGWRWPACYAVAFTANCSKYIRLIIASISGHRRKTSSVRKTHSFGVTRTHPATTARLLKWLQNSDTKFAPLFHTTPRIPPISLSIILASILSYFYVTL